MLECTCDICGLDIVIDLDFENDWSFTEFKLSYGSRGVVAVDVNKTYPHICKVCGEKIIEKFCVTIEDINDKFMMTARPKIRNIKDQKRGINDS